MFKKILLIIGILILSLFSLLLFINYRVQHSLYQKVFLSGIFPSPLPEGFYKGSVQALNTSWKGKVFDASHSAGINLFGDKKVYPFKTYKGKGLQDTNLDVLKINYNIPENPFWIRLILDEIVEIEPGKYLGKVHLNLIPHLPLSLGYFKLEN